MSRRTRPRRPPRPSVLDAPSRPRDPLPPIEERRARWANVTLYSRRQPVLKVATLGILVEASNPEEMAAATEAKILRRAGRERN